MSRISLQANLCMTRKDQVSVANVVFTNPTWKTLATSVISRPTDVAMKLNTIANIHKYRRLHEGHHFILMAMEVHGAPRRDMDYFIMECARLFHNRQSGGHLFLSFCIQFFKQHVNIAFQRALTSVIKRNITLEKYVCSRPAITFKSHNLHACNIKRDVGEITSYR